MSNDDNWAEEKRSAALYRVMAEVEDDPAKVALFNFLVPSWRGLLLPSWLGRVRPNQGTRASRPSSIEHPPPPNDTVHLRGGW